MSNDFYLVLVIQECVYTILLFRCNADYYTVVLSWGLRTEDSDIYDVIPNSLSLCRATAICNKSNEKRILLTALLPVVVVASHSHRENPCRNYIVPFWRACGNSMRHSSVHNSFESITFAISHTPLIKTQRFHFHIHGWTYIIQSFYGRSSETPLNGVLGKPKKL